MPDPVYNFVHHRVLNPRDEPLILSAQHDESISKHSPMVYSSIMREWNMHKKVYPSISLSACCLLIRLMHCDIVRRTHIWSPNTIDYESVTISTILLSSHIITPFNRTLIAPDDEYKLYDVHISEAVLIQDKLLDELIALGVTDTKIDLRSLKYEDISVSEYMNKWKYQLKKYDKMYLLDDTPIIIPNDCWAISPANCPTWNHSNRFSFNKIHPGLVVCSRDIVLTPIESDLDNMLFEYIRENKMIETVTAGTVLRINDHIFPVAKAITIIHNDRFPKSWDDIDTIGFYNRHLDFFKNIYYSHDSCVIVDSDVSHLMPTKAVVFPVYTREGTISPIPGQGVLQWLRAISVPYDTQILPLYTLFSLRPSGYRDITFA